MTIHTQYFDAGEDLAFKAHSVTSVGEVGVPGHFEVPALPTIRRLVHPPKINQIAPQQTVLLRGEGLSEGERALLERFRNRNKPTIFVGSEGLIIILGRDEGSSQREAAA